VIDRRVKRRGTFLCFLSPRMLRAVSADLPRSFLVELIGTSFWDCRSLTLRFQRTTEFAFISTRLVVGYCGCFQHRLVMITALLPRPPAAPAPQPNELALPELWLGISAVKPQSNTPLSYQLAHLQCAPYQMRVSSLDRQVAASIGCMHQ
jgi:hypothetical protein